MLQNYYCHSNFYYYWVDLVAVITTPIHSDVRQKIIEKETDKAIRNPAFIFDADDDFMEIEDTSQSID